MDLPVSDVAARVRPVILARPARQTTPLVFASAHSGRVYPPDFLVLSRLDALGLRRSEDSFVEELFAAAPSAGAPLLAATFPRAFCDANREKWELDPAMFEDELPPWVNTSSARVGAGLGMIARVVASGEAIYRTKLPFAEAQRRAREFWTPFHETLGSLVAETKQAFGACLLIDCHSMPANSCESRRPSLWDTKTSVGCVDVVLGDAHGTACAPRISAWIERALQDSGYAVRRNDPYAGGYITRHYGRPSGGVHALQIEINRGLYMDEVSIRQGARFGRVQQDIARLIAGLAASAVDLLQGA
jgi:N-formylglutamate deformylase